MGAYARAPPLALAGGSAVARGHAGSRPRPHPRRRLGAAPTPGRARADSWGPRPRWGRVAPCRALCPICSLVFRTAAIRLARVSSGQRHFGISGPVLGARRQSRPCVAIVGSQGRRRRQWTATTSEQTSCRWALPMRQQRSG
ncbi:hypothetical protein C2845_PM06G07890 [Panicum miliaceum]|uniref:Uncharacterized protein n=1 Tax=Panicum miliaceum TaxID=4540 RepID=A0A3L6R6J3_PANMI|nr:hypothetical protein C2845_PM06G07890 [Panicum miliaceum]